MALANPESTDSLAADHALMVEAVRAAGILALEYFERDLDVRRKADRSPVTEADLAVDALLHERLRGARPDYGWLSEETEDDRKRLGCRRTWVVDPIDGTRAFIKGLHEFTIVAALVEDERPLAAAVYAPATDDFYEARIGEGARRNGETLSVRDHDRIENIDLIASSGFVSLPIWHEPWPAMQVTDINSIAYRLCLVAEGRYHAAMRLKGCYDWDLAAADLILTEAGGIATTHEGEAFRYNRETCDQGSFVAAGPVLQQMLKQHMSTNLKLRTNI